MEQQFENRFIVDIKSETHRKSLDNELSYLEGIVYNTIAYDQEHFGNCELYRLPDYLHITQDELVKATSGLTKKGLISIEDGEASIRKWTLEELKEDPVINSMLECFVELMKTKGVEFKI